MSQLLIKQRVFSWTDAYDVYDGAGNKKYFVRADILSIGHCLRVYDTYGNELGVIRQRLLTLLPAFEIYAGGGYLGRVQKELTLFRPRYHIDFMNWQAQGDFMGWDYNVTSPYGSVAYITKQLFHWGDTYVINVNNPQDELSALMLIIAIDAANCSSDSINH